MRKSILASIMVIGAVIAIAAGASTFATFTDSNSATGTVKTGTIALLVNTTEPTSTLTFTLGDTDCVLESQNMGFGEACDADVVITNDGSLNAVLTQLDVDAEDSTCYTNSLVNAPALSTAIAAGASLATFQVRTTVTGDADACQGLEHEVTLTTVISQDGDGH